MKSLLFTSLFLFFVFSVKSQVERGVFMAEGGINMAGNWDYEIKPFTEGFGISFGSRDYFARDYITKDEKFWHNVNNTSYALSPKFGYSLFRNFIFELISGTEKIL